MQLPDHKHYYTVPYQYIGYKEWGHYDNKTVEVYYRHECIAFHVRSSYEPLFNRIADHMPANHQYMEHLRGWTAEDLMKKAEWVGRYTWQAADLIIHSSIYPEQNFKACHAMIILQANSIKNDLRLPAEG